MRTRSSPLLGLGMAVACLASLSAQDTRGDRADAGSGHWDTFVADVTIRHRRLQRDGTPIGVEPAPIRYRWERTAGPKGWKTVTTFAPPAWGTAAAAGRPQDARYDVARVEDDGDGTPVRAYNRRGEEMRLPPPDALGLKSGRHLLPDTAVLAAEAAGQSAVTRTDEWIESLIASSNKVDGRRGALKRRYGTHTGKVRGLQRFVKAEGDETEELLADPDSALPMEVNVVRGGRLVWHGRLAYSRDQRGAYVRRAMHVEQVVSDEGERMATDFELANVRVERRGRP